MFDEEKGRYYHYDDPGQSDSVDFSKLNAVDWTKIKHVRVGILLLMIDKIIHCLIAVGCLVLLASIHGSFIEEVGQPGNRAAALGMLVALAMGVFCLASCPVIVSGILGVIGTALCIDVPRVTGARGPIIISVVCSALVGLTGEIAGHLQPVLGMNIPLPSLSVMVAIPLWLASYTTFTIFLLRLSRFFRARHLPKRISTVTFIQVLFLGMLFVSVGADGAGNITPERLFLMFVGVAVIYLSWALTSIWVYRGFYRMLGNLPLPTR